VLRLEKGRWLVCSRRRMEVGISGLLRASCSLSETFGWILIGSWSGQELALSF
jgi:hypothetical protein